MTTLDTIKDELLAWDASRPRSQQVETGASGIGGCRAQALLRLTGVPQSDARLGWESIVGTAIHSVIERAAGRRVIVEQRFSYRGVPCTIDRYDPATQTLTDAKTKNDAAAIAKVQRYGPSESHQAQVQIGAAALIEAGHQVDTVELLFVPRAGTLDGAWCWSAPFDRARADAAAEWSAEQDARARSYDDGSGADHEAVLAGLDGLRDEPERFCRDYCEWATTCRGPERPLPASDDPLVAQAAADHDAGKALQSEGEALIAAARPLLLGVTAQCGPWSVRTSGGNTKETVEVDIAQVLADYRAIIGDPPTRTVSKTTAQSLRVTRAKS